MVIEKEAFQAWNIFSRWCGPIHPIETVQLPALARIACQFIYVAGDEDFLVRHGFLIFVLAIFFIKIGLCVPVRPFRRVIVACEGKDRAFGILCRKDGPFH